MKTTIRTVYSEDVKVLADAQKIVVERFVDPKDNFLQVCRSKDGISDPDKRFHGVCIDKDIAAWSYYAGNDDVFMSLDVDAIPMNPAAIEFLKDAASVGVLVGVAGRANHIENGGHIYASPSAMAFSRTTYARLGFPSFLNTSRGDTGEELTYRAESAGIKVHLIYPTRCQKPLWKLRGDRIEFGEGTFYGMDGIEMFYHQFHARHRFGWGSFQRVCDEIITAQRG